MKTLKEERDRLSSQLLRQGQLLVAEQPKSLADELKDAPKADVCNSLYNDSITHSVTTLICYFIFLGNESFEGTRRDEHSIESIY